MIPPKWADFFAQQRKVWTEENLGRKLRAMRPKAGGRVVIGAQELVNFSSNDYLGFVSDMRIAEAAARAAGRYGWGTGASRLVTGSAALHAELENEIARFRGTEAALLFGSGYQANLGAVSALAGPGDAIFSDTLNHASIVAACRLSGAEVHVFEHRAYADLETDLEVSKVRGRRMIVTDSLFSLEGTAADLARLMKISQRFEALLVVDDAHANAVVGQRGRGIGEVQGVSAELPVVTATFSKGLGSYGGFVACSRDMREFFINRSRPFAFTTSLPLPLVAANIEALKIATAEGEQLRAKLAGLVRTLRTKLAAAEFEPLGEHHIVPIVIGDEDKAVAYSEALESLGMLVYAMRFPSVPKGRATLRVSVSAAHTDDDIYRLVNAFKTARDRVKGKPTSRMTHRESRRPQEATLPAAAAEKAKTRAVDLSSLISQVADPQAAPASTETQAAETPASAPAETPAAETPAAESSPATANTPATTPAPDASANPGETLLPEGAPPKKPKTVIVAAPPPPPPSGPSAEEVAASDAASTLVPELDALTPSEAAENYKGKDRKTMRKTRAQKRT